MSRVRLATRADQDPPQALTRDEARALLGVRARQSLGLSGEDFVAMLRAGDLPDTTVVRSLAILAGERPR